MVFPGTVAAQDSQSDSTIQWSADAQFSATFLSGQTKQNTIVVDGTVARRALAKDGTPALRRWSHVVVTEITNGGVEIGGTKTTVADSQSVRYLLEYDLSPRTFILLESSYSRNSILAIDYHVEELAGYGVRFFNRRGLRIDVVGGGGAVQQDKNIPELDGSSAVLAVYQNATYQLFESSSTGPTAAQASPRLAWSERLLYLGSLENSDDRRLDFKTTLAARVIGPLTVSLSYRLVHEAIVATGNEQRDRQFTLGAGFHWSR